MFYRKPGTYVVHTGFSQACSQYQLIVTQQGCPNLAGINVGFSDEGFLGCGDATGLAFAQAQPNQSSVVTCTNISGSYNLTLFYSSAHFGSGLSCTGGKSTIVVPLSISPDLPGDCIVDTYIFGSSGEICG